MNRDTPAPFIIDQCIRIERSRSQLERLQIQIENIDKVSWQQEIKSTESNRGSCTINQNINLDIVQNDCISNDFNIL